MIIGSADLRRGSAGTSLRDAYGRQLAAMEDDGAMVRCGGDYVVAVAHGQPQGRYEPARQLASRFFTTVQQRALTGPEEQRAALQAILAQRDVTITLLSRGDAAATPTLVRLVTEYRALVRGVPAR